MSELHKRNWLFEPKAPHRCAIALGRLHYMPPIQASQVVFTSNHLLLTAHLQDNTLPLSFLEETVKPDANLNKALPAGGIFSSIVAAVLFKLREIPGRSKFFAQKTLVKAIELWYSN